MRSRRLVAAGLTGALSTVLLATLLAPSAAADVTSTATCTDGGGVTWRTKVVWGSTYRPAGATADRVSVGTAGWTTNARTVATDSEVRTYSAGGLSQTLTKTASPDYQSGAYFDQRNPADPLSVPGRTKVTISVGRDNDGMANCLVTHLQPGPAPTSAPTQPSAAQAVAVTSTGLGTARLSWSAVAGATGYVNGRNGADTSGAGPWSTTDSASTLSRTFDKLVVGATYTFSVRSLPGGTTRTVQLRIPTSSTTAPTTAPPTTASPTTTPPPTTTSPRTGKVPLVGKSRLAWNSIVFGHGTAPAAFEAWRNRPVDGVLYFPGRNSWADMGQLPARRSGDLMVYSIPPFPEGVGGSTTKVAAGAYDANIRALAAKMSGAGWNNNRTVIRLGWENNGNWYQWGWDKGGTANYVKAFQRFVTVSRAAGLSDVKWDWNLNKGTQAYNAGYSWTAGYPGDAYVDVIGIDPYDMWSPTFTDAQWQANIKGKNPGLQDVADFARAHGKQMAVDEWGVVHDPAGGGGDNPFYVAKMLGFLKANADVIAWDNTYDHDGAPSSWNHKLSDGGNPRAAAEYRKVYPNGWGG